MGRKQIVFKDKLLLIIMNRKHYNKQYYEKNKSQILERITKKVYCSVCNSKVSKVNYPRHCRTDRHKRLLNQQYDKDNLWKYCISEELIDEHKAKLAEVRFKDKMWEFAVENGLLPTFQQIVLDIITKGK